MSIYTAELQHSDDQSVAVQFSVLVSQLDSRNTLVLDSSMYTAWMHCIIDFAIRGRIIDAIAENHTANDQEMSIEYMHNTELDNVIVTVTWYVVK